MTTVRLGAVGYLNARPHVYNLESSLASALIADACAELYDTLPDEEKLRSSGGTGYVWEADDRDWRRRNRE